MHEYKITFSSYNESTSLIMDLSGGEFALLKLLEKKTAKTLVGITVRRIK